MYKSKCKPVNRVNSIYNWDIDIYNATTYFIERFINDDDACGNSFYFVFGLFFVDTAFSGGAPMFMDTHTFKIGADMFCAHINELAVKQFNGGSWFVTHFQIDYLYSFRCRENCCHLSINNKFKADAGALGKTHFARQCYLLRPAALTKWLFFFRFSISSRLNRISFILYDWLSSQSTLYWRRPNWIDWIVHVLHNNKLIICYINNWITVVQRNYAQLHSHRVRKEGGGGR